jgi:hypothetical protein
MDTLGLDSDRFVLWSSGQSGESQQRDASSGFTSGRGRAW